MNPPGPTATTTSTSTPTACAILADRSFDAVVASHVIEHLANPVAALQEFHRVLRPGGQLVLIVPDRSRTFDAVREPTSIAHVLAEHDQGVTAVDDEHVREFCTAIWNQPSIHPEPVRSWHDPARLDEERLELHRRRSIHVHVWRPEEFAGLIAATAAVGLGQWELRTHYLVDDTPDHDGIEFGLVLTVPPVRRDASDAAVAFVQAWSEQLLDHPARDPQRLARLTEVLADAVSQHPEVAASVRTPAEVLASRLASVRAEVEAARAATAAAQQDAAAVRGSRTFRAGQAVVAPVRMLRGRGSEQ